MNSRYKTRKKVTVQLTTEAQRHREKSNISSQCLCVSMVNYYEKSKVFIKRVKQKWISNRDTMPGAYRKRDVKDFLGAPY